MGRGLFWRIMLAGVCVLLCASGGSALAEVSGGYVYEITDDGKAVVVQYRGSAEELVVPWQLGNRLVAEIGEEAFAGNQHLTKITFPIGLTVIRSGALCGCARLSEVVLPQRLETLEDSVFRGCTSLMWLSVPDGIFEIGEECFEPDTVLVSSPGSVAQAYAEACGQPFLNAAFFSPGEIAAAPTAVPDLSKDYTFSVSDGEATVLSYLGGDYNVIVPSKLGGCPVTRIGMNAFSSCYGVERVVLPEGLTTLDKNAFRFCQYMTEVVLPSTLTVIEEYAFFKCSALESITIPEGVTRFGRRVFEGCTRLRAVTLPASLDTIPKYTFFECHEALTIFAPRQSAAHRFAVQYGIRFVPSDE